MFSTISNRKHSIVNQNSSLNPAYNSFVRMRYTTSKPFVSPRYATTTPIYVTHMYMRKRMHHNRQNVYCARHESICIHSVISHAWCQVSCRVGTARNAFKLWISILARSHIVQTTKSRPHFTQHNTPKSAGLRVSTVSYSISVNA